jgi:proteasome lid subunit RPN8/RPN11
MQLIAPVVPEMAIVQGDAARVAETLSVFAWHEKKSECGGLLWGRLVHDGLGDAAWIAAMTPGVGRASAVEFEIAPESYLVGQKLLKDAGFPEDLVELGLWHSHPGYGAFLSTVDEDYFRLCFPQAWMLSVVIDPLHGERAIFVKTSSGFARIPGYRYEGTQFAQLPALDASGIWDAVKDRIHV